MEFKGINHHTTNEEDGNLKHIHFNGTGHATI